MERSSSVEASPDAERTPAGNVRGASSILSVNGPPEPAKRRVVKMRVASSPGISQPVRYRVICGKMGAVSRPAAATRGRPSPEAWRIWTLKPLAEL